MTCTADARPEPSYKIFLKCQMVLVQSNKTYIIPEVSVCDVGHYKCVAENFLGNAFSDPVYLSLFGKFTVSIRYRYFVRHGLLICGN